MVGYGRVWYGIWFGVGLPFVQNFATVAELIGVEYNDMN